MKYDNNNLRESMKETISFVLVELEKAETKHPVFPSGTAAVSVIAEEFGEYAQSVNDFITCKQDNASSDFAQWHIIEELAHIAVTSIRALEKQLQTWRSEHEHRH